MIRKGEELLRKKKYPDTRIIFSLAEIFAAKLLAERN
jgi:hypothetical protein